MTGLAHQFWVRCEHAKPIFSADELQWTQPEELERFRVHGFLREAAMATRAVCDACDDGHAEDVVWIRKYRDRAAGAVPSMSRSRRGIGEP